MLYCTNPVVQQRYKGGQVIFLKSFTIHPRYVDKYKEFDIAIGKLKTHIRPSKFISYATLPQPMSEPLPGSSITAAGWGILDWSQENIPPQMHKVSIPVVSRDECKDVYGGIYVSERMFCAAAPEGGKDFCLGDNGGPAVDKNGVLVGIMSWGYQCAVKGSPGVYTRVGYNSILQFIISEAKLP
ncbi:Trypsin-2 [Pleosporales sp. CAS-2024a]